MGVPLWLVVVLAALAVGIVILRFNRGTSATPLTREAAAARIEAEFRAADWAEAKALVEEAAGGARPEYREIFREKILDTARGDLPRLRQAVSQVGRVYGLIDRIEGVEKESRG